MMSLKSIRDANERAAKRAAARTETPAFWLNSKAALNKPVPYFGDYEPRGFDRLDPAELVIPGTVREAMVLDPICARGYLEVDTSGYGRDTEPVLTRNEFMALAESNPDIGWAIAEAGQFQAVLACFRKGA